MLQLTPQSRIFLATQPVDFRKGIDGLCAVCRQALGDNPLRVPSTSSATAPPPPSNSYATTVRAFGCL
jgi:hypothetical protein